MPRFNLFALSTMLRPRHDLCCSMETGAKAIVAGPLKGPSRRPAIGASKTRPNRKRELRSVPTQTQHGQGPRSSQGNGTLSGPPDISTAFYPNPARVEAISQKAVQGELHRLNAMLTYGKPWRNSSHGGTGHTVERFVGDSPDQLCDGEPLRAAATQLSHHSAPGLFEPRPTCSGHRQAAITKPGDWTEGRSITEVSGSEPRRSGP